MSLKKRVNNAQAAAAPQKQPGQLVAVGNVGADIPGGVDGGKQNFDNDNGKATAPTITGTETPTHTADPLNSISTTKQVGLSFGSPAPTENPSSTSTHTSLATNDVEAPKSSSGLATGAKVGLGVGIPIALILIGLLVFFLFRRRKQTAARDHAAEKGEVIMGKLDQPEDHSAHSSPVAVAGAGIHPQSHTPPPQLNIPVPLSSSPIGHTPERRRTLDEEEMDRPVSPVQPDEELLSSTGVNSDGVSFTRGVDGESAVDEDDREMAWILEEERKARERREQAGRLPTTR